MDNSKGSPNLDLSAFASKNCDPIAQLWQILPDDPDPQLISRLLSQTQLHHNQLTHQMYAKVVAQHEAMEQAKHQIQTLTIVLRDAKSLAERGRDGVKEAKADLATGSLKVLALNKRREEYVLLAKNIQNIKRVVTMRAALQEKIQEGDFLTAISLCLECQHLITECKDFECLAGMNAAIKVHYNEIISLLGVALADACRPPFNPILYQKTINAFRLTRKASRVVVRINKQFSKFVTSATLRSLSSHVMIDPANLENAEAIKQMKFRDLLKHLKETYFPSCFNMIVAQMCDIMYAQYSMIQFHENQASDPVDTGIAYGRELAEGLRANSKVLWDEMQRQITLMCQSETLLSFKTTNFLSILDGLNTFVNIGEQFSHEPAHKLRGLIKTISKGFYDEFHLSCMETLRQQLSEELWTRTPANSRFNPRDIKELNEVLYKHFPSGHANASLETKIAVKGNKFFELYATQGNPFSNSNQSTKGEEKLTSTPMNGTSRIQDVDQELLGEPSDLKGSSRKRAPSQTGPVLTTTLLQSIKTFAQYIEMMKVLNHISWDICQGLLLFSSTYAHTILCFFSPALNIPGIRTTTHFKTFIQTMNEVLKIPSARPVIIPKLNSQVDTSQNAINGLLPLSVAAESLSFLHETLKTLKPFIQSLLPKAHIQAFQQSCISSIDSLPEVRLIIYKALSHKLLPSESLIQLISNVNWNCHEQPAATPSYINHVANSLEQFSKRFDKFIETQSGQNLAYRVSKQVWESLMSHICDCLVEGFSTQQCSPMGRAMMGIDFQNIQHIMEKVAQFKIPITSVKYVDTYIKAYFQAPEELETWLKEHTEYSFKQSTALVNCAEWTPEVKRRCIRFLSSTQNK